MHFLNVFTFALLIRSVALALLQLCITLPINATHLSLSLSSLSTHTHTVYVHIYVQYIYCMYIMESISNQYRQRCIRIRLELDKKWMGTFLLSCRDIVSKMEMENNTIEGSCSWFKIPKKLQFYVCQLVRMEGFVQPFTLFLNPVNERTGIFVLALRRANTHIHTCYSNRPSPANKSHHHTHT